MTPVPGSRDGEPMDEAADWVVRLADEDATPEEKRRFVAWLKRSPVHMEHFLRAEKSWADLAAVDPERRLDLEELKRAADWGVAELRGRAADLPPRKLVRPRLGRWPVALAACALLLLIGVLFIGPRPSEDYATGVGEQRTVRLSDGSMLTLNTRSRASVRYSRVGRSIELREGEALFKVAKDPARPFLVWSGHAVVRAVGTEFVVRREPASTAVTVLEGRVSVARRDGRSGIEDGTAASRSEPAIPLNAGGRAEVEASRIRTSAVSDASLAVAWRSGRLVFQGETLAQAVAEFNRYNEVQLVVRDAALARERISGVFDVDQPQALVRFLEVSRAIDPPRSGGRSILLEPAGASAR
jgi:transmembrane sensor